MANFFSGYLAQGTGTGSSFIENVTSGYTRQAVTLAALSYGQTGLNAGVTFPGISAPYSVTQRALYDAATGGNLIMWWALRSPVSISAGGTDTLASGSFSLTFPDLITFLGSTVQQWTAGIVIGSTSFSTSVYAGVGIAYTAGSMEASSSAGLGGGTGGTTYTFGTGLTNSSGTVTVNFGSTAGTAAQGNDSRLALASTALQPAALPTASSTFTPALVIGGASSGATYTVQTGRYAQVGPEVSFNLDLEWSALGTSMGAVTITGLPAAAVNGGCGQLAIAGYGVSTSGTPYAVVNNAGIITLLVGGTGTGSSDAALTNLQLASAGGLVITGKYFAA